MTTTHASHGPPRPTTSHTLFVLFTLDVVVALWCATQVVAHAWDYDRRLGLPLLALSPSVSHLATIASILLVGSALSLLTLRPQSWRVSLVGLLVAGTVALVGLGPVYAPQQVVLWALRYRNVPLAAPTLHAGLLAFCEALIAAVLTTFTLRGSRTRRAPSDSHGTACWGTGDALYGTRGVLLGRLDGQLLRYDGDGHLITIAPTRAGKGVGVVIPNLLTYPGSIIVTDPKAENYLVTARHRRESQCQVHAFDPFEVVGSETATFNPLDLIDGRSKDTNDDARMLADMLVVLDGREMGEQAFWNEEARALLAGLILHVATSAPAGERHLPRVRELLTLPPDEFEALLQEMRTNSAADGLVSRAAARLLQKADKERSGVVSSAQAHTHFLDSPRMAGVLTTSTVNLSALLTSCVTYYFILPPDRLPAYHRWLRLMIACCLITMTRQARVRNQPRPAHRVLFLLDEFGHLGRLQPVERDMTLVAGYGVSFWLLLQDLTQLKAVYPEKWQSFLANADVLQTFGTTDWETAEHLSKLTGESTIYVESDNLSRGVSHGRSGGRQESTARTIAEKGRRLLLPDEVRRLPRTKQLLFVRESNPLCADTLSYLRDPEFTDYDPNPMVV